MTTFDDRTTWSQIEAIHLCKRIESVCPQFGCHVALTGGLLYKSGNRKDCDILFYRIRQRPTIDIPGLWLALRPLGIEMIKGFGWCYKCKFNGKQIDCFFPEEQGSEYPVSNENTTR